MDIYEQALKRLRADTRSLRQLKFLSGIPDETLRDLKSGKIKSPRLETIRKVAAFYFPTKFKKAA